MIPPSSLLDALENVLHKCLGIPTSRASDDPSLPGDVAVLCLERTISKVTISNVLFQDQEEFAKQLATMIFPLLLVIPKTQRLNLKALDSAKEVKWPFYQNVITASGTQKMVEHGRISSIIKDTERSLAETFSMHPEEYMPCLVKCCNLSEQSKMFFFLLQSFMTTQICAARMVTMWWRLEEVDVTVRWEKDKKGDMDITHEIGMDV